MRYEDATKQWAATHFGDGRHPFTADDVAMVEFDYDPYPFARITLHSGRAIEAPLHWDFGELVTSLVEIASRSDVPS